MAGQETSARMAERLYTPGEPVPYSGVYRITHDTHREHHDGILLKGQVFPRCSVCGESARFRLMQASNSIEQQRDVDVDVEDPGTRHGS